MLEKLNLTLIVNVWLCGDRTLLQFANCLPRVLTIEEIVRFKVLKYNSMSIELQMNQTIYKNI
jgi:hypothetical protein